MRKLAPVFIAVSVLAVSSTAFAFGDKRDNKASPSTTTTTMPAQTSSNPSGSMSAPATTAPMTTSQYTAPSTSATTTTGAAPTVPVTGASDATTSGSSMGATGSMSSGMPADKSTGNSKKAAAASNDATKCDATRYSSSSMMPKDCLDGAKGGAAVGSTQGQSGK